MKNKVIVVLLFLFAFTFSYAQNCFVSEAVEKSIEIIKKVDPKLKKVFFIKESLGNFACYKIDKVKKLIFEHKFPAYDFTGFLEEHFENTTYFNLCYAIQKKLEEKENITILKHYRDFALNHYISFPDGINYSDNHSVTILPFSPIIPQEDEMIFILDCYFSYGYKDSSGYEFFMADTGRDFDQGPDVFIFVFKIKDENVVPVKLQIYYSEGYGFKAFCDTPEEIRKYLEIQQKKGKNTEVTL